MPSPLAPKSLTLYLTGKSGMGTPLAAQGTQQARKRAAVVLCQWVWEGEGGRGVAAQHTAHYQPAMPYICCVCYHGAQPLPVHTPA